MLSSLLLMLLCVIPPSDGSVIFISNGFLVRPIYKHTGSTIVHTAIILYDDGKPFVYEATWPRVRKMPLDQYYDLLAKHKQKNSRYSWEIVQPQQAYSQTELVKIKQYAISQLGRPYMLRGYWKGREVKGIFCSQYVGNSIGTTNRIKSKDFKETPISLYLKLKQFARK